MTELKIGAKAPDFTLPNKDLELITLSKIDADFVVVYFYPKDNTPGCTIETKGFNKDLKAFAKLNTSIIGISGGDEKSKAKFCKAHNLKLELLSDSDFKIAKKYKSYGPKKFMGKSYMGIFRKTFIIDNKKKIRKIFDKVTPETHSKEVLEAIKELQI
jgi:thioredoxin-dependent peroxiredoxin